VSYPLLVTRAVARLLTQGQGIHAACGWEWSVATSGERIAVDEWIVATQHPLGALPSTAERRFTLLVREAAAAAGVEA
jgi:hypothetical protein